MKPKTAIDTALARETIAEMLPATQSDLIPLLQQLQDAYGYLPREVIESVTEETGIPLSQVVGVATFYEQFSMTPRGRHIIRACRGTACHVRGAAGIAAAIEKHLGVSEGATTADLNFTFYTVACLGTCFLAPVIMVDENYYGQLTPEAVPDILDSYRSEKGAS